MADLIFPLLWSSLHRAGSVGSCCQEARPGSQLPGGWGHRVGAPPVRSLGTRGRPSREGHGDFFAENGAIWGAEKGCREVVGPPANAASPGSLWLPPAGAPGRQGPGSRPHCPLTVGQYTWECFFPTSLEHREKLQGEVCRPRFPQGSPL